MASIWDKFDASIDTAGLEKDVEAAAQGSGNRKEVPHGTYEVAITKLELGESKKHDPMVKVWFKIVEGDFKGSLIFMNQVINQGFQIHIVNELLRDITGEMDNPPEIAFHTYRQYGELLMDIAEAIDGNFEYSVKYGENKGFNTFKIEEVYVLVDD